MYRSSFKLLHARSKELYQCLESLVFVFFLTSDHGSAQYSVCQKLPQYDPALMPSELFNRIGYSDLKRGRPQTRTPQSLIELLCPSIF